MHQPAHCLFPHCCADGQIQLDHCWCGSTVIRSATVEKPAESSKASQLAANNYDGMYACIYGFYIYLHTQTIYLACKLNSTDLGGGCRLSDVSPRRRRPWKEPLQEETPHGVKNYWCVHAVRLQLTPSCVAALSAEQNTAARLERR